MQHATLKRRWLGAALAAMALLTVSAWANATPTKHYIAHLTSLNNSGVTGTAWLTFDMNTLTVHIKAMGLMPNIAHAQHIHGTFDGSGNPTNAISPSLAQDANGDGYIELGEGQTTYGPILIPLFNSAGAFPTTAADGTLDFTESYDLTDNSVYQSALARAGTDESDLFPLTFREIVLHGMNAPVDINDNALGLSFSKGEYDPVFPVASGVIATPEPSEWGMMLGGLGLMFGLLWLRRRRADA